MYSSKDTHHNYDYTKSNTNFFSSFLFKTEILDDIITDIPLRIDNFSKRGENIKEILKKTL